jgi:hypothetical protein
VWKDETVTLSSSSISLDAPEVTLLTWNATEKEYVRKLQLRKINIFGAAKI